MTIEMTNATAVTQEDYIQFRDATNGCLTIKRVVCNIVWGNSSGLVCTLEVLPIDIENTKRKMYSSVVLAVLDRAYEDLRERIQARLTEMQAPKVTGIQFSVSGIDFDTKDTVWVVGSVVFNKSYTPEEKEGVCA